MICFNCNNEADFKIEENNVFSDYLGCILKVRTPITICKNCGFESLDIGQLDELKKRTKIRYENQCDNNHWYKIENMNS